MKTILVLTDLTKKAQHAADFALKLGEKAHANILLYHAFVFPEPIDTAIGRTYALDDYFTLQKSSCEQLKIEVKRLEKQAVSDSGFLPKITLLTSEGPVENRIRELIYNHDIWMVAMGSKAMGGYPNFVPGTSTSEIINVSSRPVLLVPELADFKESGKVSLIDGYCNRAKGILEFLREMSLQVEPAPAGFESQMPSFAGSSVAQDRELASPATATDENSRGYLYEQNGEVAVAEDDINVLALIHRKGDTARNFFTCSTTRFIVQHPNIPLLIFNLLRQPEYTEEN